MYQLNENICTMKLFDTKINIDKQLLLNTTIRSMEFSLLASLSLRRYSNGPDRANLDPQFWSPVPSEENNADNWEP